MTKNEQEQYLREHPHSQLRPIEGDLFNPDRSRSNQLMKKVKEKRRSIESVHSDDSLGFPTVANHLVKYLGIKGDQESNEFLKDLRSSLKRVNEFHPGKLTNVDKMKLWAKDVALRYPDKIKKFRDSMQNDGSVLGMNAVKSLDDMLGEAVKNVRLHKHSAQICREFVLNVISKH